MINIRHQRRKRTDSVVVNMAPLIDIVFLLLIFFIVTTSFVKETGIDVQRPSAATAVYKEKSNILIGIDKEGRLFFDKKEVDILGIRAHLERSLAENPEASAIIVADKTSITGIVIEVMDQCRLAGVQNISIAASLPSSDE